MKAFNPYALRMAKTLLSVNISKCNCVKKWSTIKYKVCKEFEVTGHSRFSGRLFNFLSLFLYRAKTKCYIQSNFGRSNSPVSNTRDGSNSFVGPSNFPIHLMLKYTPGSNSDGSNSRTQFTSAGRFFMCKRYDGSNQIFLYMNQSHA